MGTTAPTSAAARSTPPTDEPRRGVLAAIAFALCVCGIVAFQPISTDALWWQMSRGREVLLGSMQPSAALLTLETQREADWLGGLSACLLYMLMGAHGLMLGRLGIVMSLALLLVFRLRAPTAAAHPSTAMGLVLVAGVALLAISPALDPLPMVFDLAGVASLWWWLRSDPHGVSRRRTAAIGLLFVAWSNLSWSVAIGASLLLVAAFTSMIREGVIASRFRWWDLGIGLAAGSLNPRGLWAWVDSVRLLVPAATVSPAVLEQTPWATLPQIAWGFTEYCLVGLTLLWIAQGWSDSRRPGSEAKTRWRVAPFLLMQALAWLSAANVPLAIVWLACDLIGHPRLASELQHTAASPWMARAAAWRYGMSAGGLALVLILSGQIRSVGWGIDARLDNRLLEIALAETSLHGTALADDVRSGGMLTWILPKVLDNGTGTPGDTLRLQDVPSRALVGGRLKEHQQLWIDLRESRLTRYWRDDGSSGGWWLPLRGRDTSLLCISRQDIDLVGALEPTLWKPLSLDSPVLPYAQAGDPAYIDRLVEVLRYRRLVDLEPWSHTLPRSTGSPFDRDRLGARRSVGTAGATLRQARVFRAMDLHYAALRVLQVARQQWPDDPQLKEEVRQCQAELADAERLTAGQASWFRHWSAQTIAPHQIEPSEPPRSGRWIAAVPAAPAAASASAGHETTDAKSRHAREVLHDLVVLYLREGAEPALQQAIESTSAANHPQIAYACLCWALESGRLDHAREIGHELAEREIQANLRLLVEARLRELASPDEESTS